jgi:hypothetical protein
VDQVVFAKVVSGDGSVVSRTGHHSRLHFMVNGDSGRGETAVAQVANNNNVSESRDAAMDQKALLQQQMNEMKQKMEQMELSLKSLA